MAEPLLRLINITHFYNDKQVLDNINFEILPNSITTVIGPNGAGKTTLAKIMLGIEKPIEGWLERRASLKVSYIPQKLALDKNLPLDINAFLQLLGQGRFPRKKILEILVEVQLDISTKTSVHSLSSGQFQKLLLAAALLRNPELIVLDEATQGLDVTSQTNFYKIIAEIKSQHNCAVFMISHDLFTVMSKSDQVICLNQHICCKGTPSQILHNPEYTKIFGVQEDILSGYLHKHDHQHN